MISPLYGLTEYDLYTKESYYNGDERLYYGRQIYEYMIVILITVHFFNAFHMIIMNNFWGGPGVMWIAKMSGVEHSPLFILKSILVDSP